MVGCSSTTYARLLKTEIPLDAAHLPRVDPALVAQGHEGLSFRREQLAPPVAPGRGALRVLLGRAAGLEARLVAPDALLVVLAYLLLGVRRDPLVVAELLEPAQGRVGCS